MTRNRLARTAGVGVVDQAVYSVGNILLVLTLARVASPAEFGAFALLMTAYETLQLATRGVIIQPLALVAPDDRRGMVDGATALGLTVGAGITALGLLLLWVATPEGLTAAVTVVGLTFGPLLVLEVCRASAFAADRGPLALLLDVVWTGTQVTVCGVIILTGTLTPLVAAGAWASGCVAAAATGLFAFRVWPRLGSIANHLQRIRSYSAGLTKDNLLSAAQTHSFNWLVAALIGVVALGQLRILRALFGVATVATAGLRVALTPLARAAWATRDSKRHRKILLALAGALTALITVNVAAVEFLDLPDLLGISDESSPFDSLVVPFAVRQLAMATTIVGVIAISSTGRTAALVKPRLMVSVSAVGLSLIGLLRGSVEEALFLSALGTLLGAPVWWQAFRAEQRRASVSSPSPRSMATD